MSKSIVSGELHFNGRGTRWMHKEKKRKRVLRQDVARFISLGWEINHVLIIFMQVSERVIEK